MNRMLCPFLNFDQQSTIIIRSITHGWPRGLLAHEGSPWHPSICREGRCCRHQRGGRGGHKCHLKKFKMVLNNPKPRALSTWVKERGRDTQQEGTDVVIS